MIASADHPRLSAGDGAPPSLDAYCAEVHVVAAPGGTAGGIVDRTLRRVGRMRTVGVTTTGFMSALDLVARSDMIATVPARLARMQAETFRLSVRPPPIAPRSLAVSATWHRRAARRSGHRLARRHAPGRTVRRGVTASWLVSGASRRPCSLSLSLALLHGPPQSY